MQGTVWVLNDSADAAPEATAEVYLLNDGQRQKIAELKTGSVSARKNGKFGSFKLTIDKDVSERFTILIECPEHPEWNSSYELVHNKVVTSAGVTDAKVTDEDFSDFLK